MQTHRGCPCAHRRHHAGATRQPQPSRDGVMGSLAPEPWGAHGSRAEAWSPKPVRRTSAHTAGSLVPCGDVRRSRHLLPGLETGGAATRLCTLGRDHMPWRVDGPATLGAQRGDFLPGEGSMSPAPALGDTHFRPGQRSVGRGPSVTRAAKVLGSSGLGSAGTGCRPAESAPAAGAGTVPQNPSQCLPTKPCFQSSLSRGRAAT